MSLEPGAAGPSPDRAHHLSAEVQVLFARLEAKLDVALAQHGAKIEQHGQEISEVRTLLRKIEDRPIASPEGLLDHETRLRVVESRPVFSPTKAVGALAAVAAVVAALTPFLDRLYS